MKKFFSFLISVFIFSVLAAQQINDPNAELRSAKNFHGINVSNAFDVYINQSNDEAVAVSAADKNFKDRIKVEVMDGILYIRYDSKGVQWGGEKRALKAYISFKNIDQLTVSGACDVFFTNTISVEKLSIRQSGASDLKGKINIGSLTTDVSGASDIALSGKAGSLDIEVSGASSFKGYNLESETCNAKASGASDIKITVNRELTAEASGTSDIRYKGDGDLIKIKTSGSGSVSRSRS
ncbi:MAG TPA: head GIN domain-containing protein [Chitinophagaceae bacterium]|nr:head GIN domain-containing protein [Chitinophagaceae bacterium]HNJ26354.1 head GIN domain-containing protein [Chitinophagaceae bacterium]HNK62032.1 head GIN domain-containing protein [Chitinophagaceae bacterium]